ncbi:3-hexulose-6-phosphate synthase [Brenneria roseae subsp. roseae]|uniref:3-hexulose-6-phosphate synthase n=1 Tax=Brenneria roseae TaxID=1509241 RepID=UPI000D6084CE|nr:3-hexulose-6-phosphate synthase [Brenneria roseae]PWC22759.1 3-hexulose-6-phosphate synthase [Brenneria roseae subsp. roseae]
MKIQLALDDISLSDALALLDNVHPYIDIVEVGTPFIIQDGMVPVSAIKERFPQLHVLADTKIMDAGDYEAHLAFAAGADSITVLGVTDMLTVKACLKAAEPFGGTVVIDMICVPELEARVAQLEDAGVNALAVHTGVDQQAAGRTPMDDLKTMKACSKQSVIYVAGGIGLTTIEQYHQAGADVAIIGSGICKAADPIGEARAIAEKIHN